MTYSKSSNRANDVLKIQQERERSYSKSSKTEKGGIQNPAREIRFRRLLLDFEGEEGFASSAKARAKDVEEVRKARMMSASASAASGQACLGAAEHAAASAATSGTGGMRSTVRQM